MVARGVPDVAVRVNHSAKDAKVAQLTNVRVGGRLEDEGREWSTLGWLKGDGFTGCDLFRVDRSSVRWRRHQIDNGVENRSNGLAGERRRANDRRDRTFGD